MCVCVCVRAHMLSHVQLFVALWTVARQPPLSMGFSWQEQGVCLEMRGRSLDQEDSLEEEMATHSSVLTWEIPWTEDPGRL